MSQDEHFRNEVERLKDKYLCPDLEILSRELTEEQLQKRQFDLTDLHFKDYEFQDYQNGKLYIPPFYEDEIDLPTTGNKFIRSEVLFQKGDLVLIRAEAGFWRLKPFDTRHKEYVVENKKDYQIDIGFAYYRRTDGKPPHWAFLDEKDWKKRKAELEEDLSNPVLRQVEIDFYHLLNQTSKSWKKYKNVNTSKNCRAFLEDMVELDWYLVNVLGLWAAFKLYPISLYESLLKRIDHIYDTLIPDSFDILDNYDSELLPPNEYPAIKDCFSKAGTFLKEGYEVINNKSYLNTLRMYNERQQSHSHSTKDIFDEYKDIAVELRKDEQSKSKSSFVSLDEVREEYNRRRNPKRKK